MDNTELKHWGVKGQKWGVRRYQNKDGSLTPQGKKRYDRDIQEKKLNRISKKADKQNWSDDARAAAEIRTKRLKQMSNSELKQLNERTRLENEYKNLNKRKKIIGEKFVSDVLKESSKELAKEYTKKGMKNGVEFVRSIMQ